MLRKIGLFVVMVGALALSFSGQVDAVSPLLGHELAVVFAATNDVAALLALHEVTSSGPGSIRRWAWSVLLLSGGTALGLNTWDALKAGVLPDPAAIAVGAGPVVLAWLLSHLVALVLTSKRAAAASASATASESPAEPAPAPSVEPAAETAEAPAAEAGREAPEPTAAAASDAGHPPLAVVPEPVSEPAESPADEPEREALSTASEQTEDVLPVRLIDQAERLERQALQRSDGKRGLSFREAPRRLGVRYSTARAALEAARTRIAEQSLPELDTTPKAGSRPAA